MSKEEIVLNILREICPFADIDVMTKLIEDEVLSSLDFFSLLAALEQEFGIRIDEELIVEENFVNVETIVNTVLKEV